MCPVINIFREYFLILVINLPNSMATRSVVVKLGTSTLTAGTPRLSSPRLVELVRQMASLRQAV